MLKTVGMSQRTACTSQFAQLLGGDQVQDLLCYHGSSKCHI